MTRILAIDPGSAQSAFVLLQDGVPEDVGLVPNDEMLRSLHHIAIGPGGRVVIEWMSPRGMPTSEQEFETMWWVGRFSEAVYLNSVPLERLTRHKVKMHLCGKASANDANIRAALIDRFGGIGGKAAAVGVKAKPGPLYGVANDIWAALAVAVTAFDTP